jgi:TonB family protein
MKILEIISFSTIALGLHITVISLFLPETLGSIQKGDDEERETINLSSISFSVPDLVKSWGTSPVVKSEVSALLSAPQSDSVNPLVANDIKDPDTDIGSLSDLKLLQNDHTSTRPIIPKAFSTTGYSTLSIDQVDLQNNDNAFLDFSDTIDANPIKDYFNNRKKNLTLEISKPQIDMASVATVHEPKKLQAKPKLAGRPAQSAPEPEKSGKQQPEQKDNQAYLSPKEAKKTEESLYLWGSKIHSAIERKKFYPSGTRAQGRVILNIIIHSSGRLVNTEITRSSGITLLDNAAIAAVNRAQFPIAPEGLIEDKYRFQIPIKLSRN